MSAALPRVDDESKLEKLVPLARVGDLPVACSARGVDVVVVGGAENPVAFQGRCPHQGALLAEGRIEDGALRCPGHGWQFDCKTGERRGHPEVRLESVPIEVRDGAVFADVSSLSSRKTGTGVLRELADLPGPKGLPLLGNALQLDPARLATILDDWGRQHGPFWRLNVPGRSVMLTSDAKAIQSVLRDRPKTFRRVTVMADVLEEIIGPGVFGEEGDAWRAQRRLAMEALNARHIKAFYPTLAKVADRLRRRWKRAAETGEVLDIQETLMRFTVDVTTSLAFGIDMNTIEGEGDVIQRHLEHVFPAVMRRTVSPFAYWRYLRLAKDRALDRAVAELRTILRGLISDARTRIEADPARAAHPENFMEAMVAARDDEGRPFSDEILMGNAFTMLLAGEDTTAHSLSWMVHLLCDHPEAQSLMQHEADAVLGSAVILPDASKAAELVYTSAVANESMRLTPVVMGIFVEANEDVTVADVRVPAGTEVWTLTRLPMREAERFESPDAFKPERWLVKQTRAQEEAFIPFGTGPRICPGRSLALLEISLVACMLARSFTFERVGKSADVTELTNFTIAPQGLRVRLRERT